MYTCIYYVYIYIYTHTHTRCADNESRASLRDGLADDLSERPHAAPFIHVLNCYSIIKLINCYYMFY